MRLKEFDVKKEGKKLDRRYSGKQRLIFSGIVLLLLTILLYTSYAIFIASDKDIITNTEVGPFSTGDVRLAIYIGGVLQPKGTEFPTKGSGKAFEKVECSNGINATWNENNWTLSLSSVTKQTQCDVYFKTGTENQQVCDRPENTNNLSCKILSDNGGASTIVRKTTPDFNTVANNTTNQNGMWAAADDYGTSYYFRGTRSALNNNVIFGGFQWKIVRITGNGDIKLIYNGKCTLSGDTCTEGINGNTAGTATQLSSTSVYSANYNDTKYVGYMYGGANGTASTSYAGAVKNETSTAIKTALESWYSGTGTNDANFSASDKSKIVSSIYCNDRTNYTNTAGTTSGGGYAKETTYYGAYVRLQTNKSPSLKCTNPNDRFTLPIGLITADEVAIAGGKQGTANNDYYLRTNSTYWTMSPYNYDGSYADVFIVFTTGYLDFDYVSPAYGVRPVITLSSNAQISKGDGSTATPYIV